MITQTETAFTAVADMRMVDIGNTRLLLPLKIQTTVMLQAACSFPTWMVQKKKKAL